jgi:hypothetical protein
MFGAALSIALAALPLVVAPVVRRSWRPRRYSYPMSDSLISGTKDGGLAYTEWDLEVQNRNSG